MLHKRNSDKHMDISLSGSSSEYPQIVFYLKKSQDVKSKYTQSSSICDDLIEVEADTPLPRYLCHAADALSCRLPSGTFIATITNQPSGASDFKTWTHLLHALHWDDETPPNGKP